MWLLPPDFPANAFDLPPGTWALPWYADDPHIDALMQLLVAGERRIREWVPLPWAAVEHMGVDTQVRPGAALVLLAPAQLEPEVIVEKARSLPWPYVFWRSPRPALEGSGAWVERELKRAVLSELHRGLVDPEHPLARFHVRRLPLRALASMVGDPIDLLAIARAALLHRLAHAVDGLREEDYDHSVRWEAGQRLGEYLLRIPEDRRQPAVNVLRRGGRGPEDRAEFRRTALGLQDVGLGLLVGEDLALGPLARCTIDPVVAAGLADRIHERTRSVKVEPGTRGAAKRVLPQTRVTLPSVELTTHEAITRWIRERMTAAAERDNSWKSALGSLLIGIGKPRTLDANAAEIRRIAAINAKSYEDRRLRELVLLLLRIFSDSQSDLQRVRGSVSTYLSAIDGSSDVDPIANALDALLIERVLVQSPDTEVLDGLAMQSQIRTFRPQAPWLDATWLGISAETARLQGHSSTARSLFDVASHQWAAMELDGRTGWLQSRVSAALAIYDESKATDSEQVLDLVAKEIEVDHSHSTIHAMVPLLRGFVAKESGDSSLAIESLKSAAERFGALHDVRGESFARTALAEWHIEAGDLSYEASVEDARQVFARCQDTRGRTYTELVLGDAAFVRSSLDEARSVYREALRLAEHTGDGLACSTAYHKLGNLEAYVHRYEVAVALERQALEIERSTRHNALAQQTERTIAGLEGLADAEPGDG